MAGRPSPIIAQGYTFGLIAISFPEPPLEAGVFVIQEKKRLSIGEQPLFSHWKLAKAVIIEATIVWFNHT